MPSMYETIMELPLFKGIGEEQLSVMLEKTSVEFLRFEDGDTIAKADDIVLSVDFILGGRVRQTYTMQNYPLAIDEILGKGDVIGALHLYGMETSYTCNVKAIGRVGIMRIEKSQYMNILQSDNIYMLNFVNYLSAAAQKTPTMLLKSQKPSITRTLENLVFSVVSKSSETVVLVGEDKDLASYCGVTEKEFEAWKVSALAHNNIIVNQRGILLKSPHLLK